MFVEKLHFLFVFECALLAGGGGKPRGAQQRQTSLRRASSHCRALPVDQRIFGSWSVVHEPAANNAFAKYLECQGMPASISQLMAKVDENRFFTAQRHERAGKMVMNLVIQIPHGPFPNITFEDFRLNERFVTKYFTNGTLSNVSIIFQRYGLSADGRTCGLREKNFRPGEVRFHETYVYKSTDDGRTLSIEIVAFTKPREKLGWKSCY